jgi:hypothetical protein
MNSRFHSIRRKRTWTRPIGVTNLANLQIWVNVGQTDYPMSIPDYRLTGTDHVRPGCFY